MDVDVATEIICKLPVQSLVQFKCVSKLWMTLISDAYFLKKHLNHARNDSNSQKILVNLWYPKVDEFSLYCSSLSSVQQIEHVQKLDCPCNDKPCHYSLYCCCNGMALMGFFNYPDKHFQLLLWNPSMRESIVLPYPNFFPKDNCTWGLGYDSASDDYKILKIDDKSRGEILALKSGSWRLLDKHPIDVHPMLKSTDSLVCVHGAFHWLIRSLTKYSVMSFSITDYVYREIPFPEQLYSNCLLGRGVSELGGMLCAYSGTDVIFKIWVMKDYDNESWTNSFIILATNIQSAIPKYMFSDREMLLCCEDLHRFSHVFRTSKGPFGLWLQSDVVQNGFVYTESSYHELNSNSLSSIVFFCL